MPMVVRQKKDLEFVIPQSQLPEWCKEGDCSFTLSTPKRTAQERAAGSAIVDIHKQPLTAAARKKYKGLEEAEVQRRYRLDLLRTGVLKNCLVGFVFPPEEGNELLRSDNMKQSDIDETLDYITGDLETYMDAAIDRVSGETIDDDTLQELAELGITIDHLHIDPQSIAGTERIDEDPTKSGESA